jgi:hypothetical protein
MILEILKTKTTYDKTRVTSDDKKKDEVEICGEMKDLEGT